MWYLERIPRVVHLYWGNDSISFLRYLTVLSLKKFNPDWQIKLYHPQKKYHGDWTWSSFHHKVKYCGDNYINKLMGMDISKIEFDFEKLNIKNDIPENFKGDIFRWYILSTEGGLWSDMDIVYFKPIEELYANQENNRNADTIVCFNEAPLHHPLGLMMSAGDNEFYKFIYEKSFCSLNTEEYQCVGPDLVRNYFPNVSAIEERFSNTNVINLKKEVVYPLDHNMLPLLYNGDYSFYITDDTLGLHWYAGSNVSAQFENIVTENNFTHFDNVISKVIARVV